MENLSLEQAREVKKSFEEKDLPQYLRQVINGVGLCKIQDNPEVYGVVVNLEHSVDDVFLLCEFPEELQDNVRIHVIGTIQPQMRGTEI